MAKNYVPVCRLWETLKHLFTFQSFLKSSDETVGVHLRSVVIQTAGKGTNNSQNVFSLKHFAAVKRE